MTEQPDNSEITKPHSRLGIISTIIGITVPLLIGILFLLGVLLGTKKGTAGNYVAIGFVIFGVLAPLLHLLGIVLAVIGFISKKTKKLFPVIGLLLNLFLGIIGLVIIFFVIKSLSVPHF